MRVYRVQNDDGKGPYSLPGTFALLEGKSGMVGGTDDLGVRWPTHGSMDDVPVDNVLFGFDSPEQLTSWFTADEREALERAGYKATIWDAPRVWPGRKQLVFDPAESQLVETRPLTEVAS